MTASRKPAQMLSWFWLVTSADAALTGGHYLRSQPVWKDRGFAGDNNYLVGWKLYAQVTAPRGLVTLGLRADLGGGQVEAETDEARPLIAARWPIVDANDYTPRGVFAAFRPDVSPYPGPDEHLTFSGWPGCSACLPVRCDDSVRVLVRTDAVDVDWRVRLNLIMWISEG